MFRVMFSAPKIAPNTGNAIRMVAATGCELHLVQPLGFDLSEPKLRRAGLDYHDLASVTWHDSLAAAWRARLPGTRADIFCQHLVSARRCAAVRSGADGAGRPYPRRPGGDRCRAHPDD